MMKRSINRALDRMNELEKEEERMHDKAYDADMKDSKMAGYYYRKADDIACEINGMAACLRILGLGVWRECGRDTDHVGVWHIPLDDIEKVC